MTTRRGLIVCALVVVCAVGLDTLAWWLAENWLQSGYSQFARDSAAQGWVIEAGTPERGGWPLAATLTLPGAAISDGATVWRADRVQLRLSPAHPTTLVVAMLGRQEMRLDGLAGAGFSAARFAVIVPLFADASASGLALEADDLRLEPPAAGTVARLRLAWTADPASLVVHGSASDVGLPQRIRWALGAHVAALAWDARLSGPWSDLPGLYPRARFWRDGGGKLQLQRLSLSWGALELSGDAALMLDGRMQPAGTASARVIDPIATLDALAAGGAMTSRSASAVKAMLSLMMPAPPQGAKPQVELPLTLRDGKLSIGGIPLADMPQIIWPDSP